MKYMEYSDILLITSFYADLSICVNKFCNAENTISMA